MKYLLYNFFKLVHVARLILLLKMLIVEMLNKLDDRT